MHSRKREIGAGQHLSSAHPPGATLFHLRGEIEACFIEQKVNGAVSCWEPAGKTKTRTMHALMLIADRSPGYSVRARPLGNSLPFVIAGWSSRTTERIILTL